jgi:protein-S-isoprenylcysteine O-methyltransferase Ste14
MLDSDAGMLPAVAVVVLTCVRTMMEDRILNAQLPGYPDYARRVRSRLLPGVW